MKNAICTLAIATVLFSAGAMAQSLPIPAPSPTCTISQGFAGSTIDISYSRPGVKGRKIFGDIVPFGKVWRTGANAPTTITFGDDVTIAGTKVAKGKYGLLTIPEANEWTIIITKEPTNNAASYKEANDVVRVKSKTVALPQSIESFTIDVNNIKNTEADVYLMWDKTEVSFKISTEIDSKVMAAIDKEMANDRRPFFQAATYLYDNNKDMKKALEYSNKALEKQPDAYWILHLKAKVQNKLGDLSGAIATATQSKEKAKLENDDAYVRNNDMLLAEIMANPALKTQSKKKAKS